MPNAVGALPVHEALNRDTSREGIQDVLLVPADVRQVRLTAMATKNGVAVTEKGDSKSLSVLRA